MKNKSIIMLIILTLLVMVLITWLIGGFDGTFGAGRLTNLSGCDTLTLDKEHLG